MKDARLVIDVDSRVAWSRWNQPSVIQCLSSSCESVVSLPTSEVHKVMSINYLGDDGVTCVIIVSESSNPGCDPSCVISSPNAETLHPIMDCSLSFSCAAGAPFVPRTKPLIPTSCGDLDDGTYVT